MRHISCFLLAACWLLAFIPAAHAYIGFGPGLGMLGYLFALAGGVAVALLMIVAYPLRVWLNRKRNRNADNG